jgi:UDP-2,4-diacetamido-2,4,6-trideoxy-beta-L-altropyranose hydrolase
MTRAAVFRCDGSTTIGWGHVLRCLVLAEELRERGWSVAFLCRDLPGTPFDRIRGAGFSLEETLPPDLDEDEDARRVVAVCHARGATWVVVDRYATDHHALHAWAEEGLRLLAIDDICEHPFPVDVLLNQNTHAHELPYQTREDTIRLLGPRFALVRRVYRDARPKTPRAICEARRVMVFMGGGDPGDATGKVVEALNAVPGALDIDIVVGAAYPHYEQLLRSTRGGPHRARVLRDLPDLAEPMSHADVAVSAGGSVSWELACMGVPMLLLPVADNQLGSARSLHDMGAAALLGRASERAVDELARDLGAWLSRVEDLSRMSEKLFALVDGEGARRVADHLRPTPFESPRGEGQGEGSLRVRAATAADSRLIWEWANDPVVRAQSFSPEPIPWNAHELWYDLKLGSASCLILVAEDENGIPLGQVRFDIDGDEAELDYHLGPGARGKGWGASLVEAGVRALAEKKGILRINARVKLDNVPSLRTLAQAGFVDAARFDERGTRCVHFIMQLRGTQ